MEISKPQKLGLALKMEESDTNGQEKIEES
jgi:hypothetical protein